MACGQVVRSLRDQRLTRQLRETNPEAQSVAAAAPLARICSCLTAPPIATANDYNSNGPWRVKDDQR